MSLVNRYIGAPIERVEDLRFLRGRGEYVADLASAEMLHAAILRSSVAHARIRAIDLEPALAIAGVHAVITRRRDRHRAENSPPVAAFVRHRAVLPAGHCTGSGPLCR